MTALTSALGALRYTAEATFCDTAQTAFGTRLAIKERIDVSGLKHNRIPSGRVVQRFQEDTPHLLGPKEGEIVTELYVTGHGSSTVGSGPHSLGDLATLLGLVVGGSIMTASASTTATGGTAAVPTTAAASGLLAGGLVFCGALGDGRGNGQASVVSAHAANSLTLLAALDAAMNNGDNIRVAENVYFVENPTNANATLPSVRFEYLSGNDHVRMWGCWPKSIQFTLSNAALPTARVTWGVSDWSFASTTFPTTTTMQTFPAAPICGGSFFKNTVVTGTPTTTRQKLNVREFTLTITLNNLPQTGPGGGQYQQIIGVRRGPATIDFEYVVDADTTTATPTEVTNFEDDSQQIHHVLYTMSAADSKAVAIYMPSCIYIGEKPVQYDMSGLNCRRVRMRAKTGNSTASEVTLSALRMGLS